MLIPKESEQLLSPPSVTNTEEPGDNETPPETAHKPRPTAVETPLTNGSINGDAPKPIAPTKCMNILQNIIIKKEEHDQCIQIPIKREIDEDILHNRIKIPRRETPNDGNAMGNARIKEEVLDIKSEVMEAMSQVSESECVNEPKNQVHTCFRCHMVFMEKNAYSLHLKHCGRVEEASSSSSCNNTAGNQCSRGTTNFLQRLEQLPRLIESVRSTPCLYNTDMDGYNNLELKDGVWNEIAGNCEFLSGKIAKATWKKLLQEFCDSLNNRQIGTINEPYRYEQQMQFMLPYIENLTTTSVHDNTYTTYSIHNFTAIPSEIIEEDDDTQSTTHITTPVKRQRISTPIMREIQPPQLPRPANTERALDLFFMSMCEGTKNLPYNLQLQVKKKIFDAVLEAESILNRVSHIRNERFSPPPTPRNDFTD